MFSQSRWLRVSLVVFAGLAIGCGSKSGPATNFLNAYEKVVRNYEAKVAGGGRVSMADINSMNSDAARMAEEAERFVDAKKGGMTSAERKRYVALSGRFGKALMALSQKMTIAP